MPVLNTPMIRDRIAYELQNNENRTSIIENQELDARYFRKPLGQLLRTDICFNRRKENTIYVLVDDVLEYIGNDLEIRNLFATNPLGGGWRQLFIPNNGNLEQTLNLTESVLGLTGRQPSLRIEREQEVFDDSKLDKKRSQKTEYGIDLVRLARQNKLAPLIGRDAELQTVMQILSKKGKNAVVLLGEAGVGKTAIVEGLACLVAYDRIPEALKDSRIIEVNLGFLAAGASLFGEFESRVKSLVEEARQDEKTILFLDELHTILSQRSDASQMLKTDLARGTIKVIGATTFSEYRQIEEDSALARRFQKVIVKEPSPGETLEILRRIKGDYEKHHNVQIPDEVLQEIIRLSVRYIKDRFLPDKAIDLMDEAAAKLKLMTLKEVGRETERGLDEQIKEAILSGDYTEAKRLCSLREK